MKIKCPDCAESDFENPINLRDHMEKRHQFKSLRRYAERTFKIHEKIEVYENELKTWTKRNEINEEILKSLLENEKNV